MVKPQSKLLIFCQHPHIEVSFTIWSRIDHGSSRKDQKSTNQKVSKLGFCIGKVNWTLTSHNSHMEHPKFSIQSSFWRKFDSLQNCVSHAKSKNASFERYGPKHYRSFSKVNKKTLFSKGHKIRMGKDFDMRPKTLVRGLFKVSKMS